MGGVGVAGRSLDGRTKGEASIIKRILRLNLGAKASCQAHEANEALSGQPPW